jgi:hypothetical protein
VNKRAISWLLSALLVISASAAVPVARARTGSASAAIVWIARERAKHSVEIPMRPATPATRPAVLLNYEPPAKGRHFAASLYQRPPPFLR